VDFKLFLKRASPVAVFRSLIRVDRSGLENIKHEGIRIGRMLLIDR